MATIGQVIYDVIDHNTGGLISTKQNLTEIIKSSNEEYEEEKIKLDENFIEKIGPLKKVGIQAPPGTKVKLNGDKEILIGRTGIYELDEDGVIITSLIFEKN